MHSDTAEVAISRVVGYGLELSVGLGSCGGFNRAAIPLNYGISGSRWLSYPFKEPSNLLDTAKSYSNDKTTIIGTDS